MAHKLDNPIGEFPVDERYERKKQIGFFVGSGFGILGLVFLVLVGVSLIRMVANQNIVTFTGFLEMLRDVPQISYDWLSFTVTDFGSTFPYGFQWFGSILDFFADFLAVSLYSGTAIANIFSVLFYVLHWLFVM